jgi:hypothetical protein
VKLDPEDVDLTRGRMKPTVLRVLALSDGSPEALGEVRAHYRSGDWPFIGLRDGDDM